MAIGASFFVSHRSAITDKHASRIGIAFDRSRQIWSNVHLPRTRCIAMAGGNEPGSTDQGRQDNLIIAGAAVALTGVATLGLTVWREPLEDFFYAQAMSSGTEWGIGDWVGGALWGVSMYFASPLQLLLLFLGKIDTERPSDWVLRQLGLASGLNVEAIDYSAPAAVRAATAVIFAVAGLGMAWLLNSDLGDATWSLSTGVAACMAAGVYEVGRPTRLSVQEAKVLEGQWQDFAKFADARLQRVGRCHESEVFGAFRKQFAKYRREEVISDVVLRDMVRNWHPDVERTPKGFYKNLSPTATIDPFSGQQVGYAPASSAAASRDGAPAQSVESTQIGLEQE